MNTRCVVLFALLIGLMLGNVIVFAESAPKPDLQWRTVANNGDVVPDDAAGRVFNSFNPPSVNAFGFVVFRGRSRGPEPPASGIFAHDMSDSSGGILYRVVARGMEVPQPNNTGSSFNEFPSFARLSLRDSVIATRGNSQPVWRYDAEGGETSVGTSGVYVAHDGVNLSTAMIQLGLIPGFENYQVPGVVSPTRFDQFPGAPSPTDEGFVLSKGNYTLNGVGQTGIFYRDVYSGDTAIKLIANSFTPIPNAPSMTFGSTAPPSAAKGKVVFVGYDDEEHPQHGGIYLADIRPQPPLTTLFGVGDKVPDVNDAYFTRFGEALSFDGRHVAFWATWGNETKTLRLHCPTEGNRDRRIYCRDVDPNTNRQTDERWQEKQVPVHQGIFVHDTVTGSTQLLARTGDQYDDFLYWNYSGHPPGPGGGHADAEPPRWRSATFVAVSNANGGTSAATVFKARTGEIDPVSHRYEDYVDGIYLRRKPGLFPTVTVVDTSMLASTLDQSAPQSAIIGSLGLERDGFRGSQLAISASSLVDEAEEEEESTWAGVYLVTIPVSYGRY